MTQCMDKTERDRLLMFIDKLLYHKTNVKLFLDANGIRVLVDLVTLAHLHTSRAHVPLQTQAIEAAPDMDRCVYISVLSILTCQFSVFY